MKLTEQEYVNEIYDKINTLNKLLRKRVKYPKLCLTVYASKSGSITNISCDFTKSIEPE